MVPGDYDQAIALWRGTEGIGVSGADSRAGIAAYLARNPGFSLVAETEERIVGTVLGGTDGRRGYLHHLAVAEAHRGCGLGTVLVGRCLQGLKEAGFTRCHCFVYGANDAARRFYERRGWRTRDDLIVMTANLADDA
jgi:ribosomal protein S18 acetylase RimI-like enzyme